MVEKQGVREVLGAAVTALGGQERPGQIAMAEAVAEAMEQRRHLLVQAGTGTGKSLAYLVPALLHHDRVVVATATLALQHQLVERDIPALFEAAKAELGEVGTYAVLKGRSNYACLHRVREGVPDDQGTLVDLAPSAPRSSPCANGSRKRRPRAARGSVTTRRGTPSGSGARSVSVTASAWARAGAPTAPSASPSAPRNAPPARTWSSPTTHCWRSMPSRASR